jgi:hypothetical protein
VSRVKVHLIDRRNGEPCEALLYDGLHAKDLLLVERQWKGSRQSILKRLLKSNVPRTEIPESLHWDWSRKAHLLAYMTTIGWAIECNAKWQGVALADTSSHFSLLESDRGKPLLYLDYIESAPWNWHNVAGQVGIYAGVGAILFRRALRHSYDLGFNGRIGLHSLPRAESFYEKACGMTRVFIDHKKEGLTYFELSRDEARRRF